MEKLITDQYLNLMKSLHQKSGDYGAHEDMTGITQRIDKAIKILNDKGKCNSFIDYGTGKGNLIKRLRRQLPETISLIGYDPAISEYSKHPESKADIVSCIDVLEHVEPVSLDYILNDIHKLTNYMCFFVIDLQPAKKILDDGRNAHVLIAPPEWWSLRVNQLFPCIISIPIYNTKKIIQKQVVFACKDSDYVADMYTFAFTTKVHRFLFSN